MSNGGDNESVTMEAEKNCTPESLHPECTTSSTQPTTDPKEPATENKSKESTGGKRKRSWVWDHYVKSESPGENTASCTYCDKQIICPSANGTSALSNHLLRCKKYPPNIDKSQKMISFQSAYVKKDGTIQPAKLETWKFDQDSCRKSLAKMVITDELPFRYVEREGFQEFCYNMQPRFTIPSRWTVTRDCFGIYIDEKNKLKKYFSKSNLRVCLTTDTWTSCQNLSYMCLTAHFVDDNWKLHKKIINFCPISSHSGEAIGKAVEGCFLDWGIENVFTVTVDNASSNDLGIAYLKSRLNSWNGCILNGDFLHMRCASHILNLIVKDGLKDIDPVIAKVRVAVRYVRSSPARLQRFKACVLQQKIESKSLVCLDVETRWNSTFLMMESALKFEKAFDLLYAQDSRYRAEIAKYGGAFSFDDWDCVRNMVSFLKIFYDATLRLSGSLYVTGNMYLQEIMGIGLMISMKSVSGNDAKLRKMALNMKKKQEKYWGNIDKINLMLFIAILLDPRRKWGYLSWIIEKSYEVEIANELSDRINKNLLTMYDFYAVKYASESQTTNSAIDESNTTQAAPVDDVQAFMELEYQKVNGVRCSEKSELDKYLLEECEKTSLKSFDVLDWWRKNAERFPVVSHMAKDVLAIPVSTVASESTFSTGGRVLDSFRSSLTPRTVEALICAQDWLRTSRNPLFVEEAIEELENLESDLLEAGDLKDIPILNMYDD